MKWEKRATEDRMNREQIQIIQLLQNLVLEHFEQKEKDLRIFKKVIMTPIEIIAKHSLTVRCLPHETINYWTYREGDENKKYVDSNGNPIIRQLEVVIQNLDLEYFQKTPTTKYNIDSPEKRYEQWKKRFPNGKKLLKETKTVKHGGWWYVMETKHTGATVIFNDKFLAPTLEEALQLYLDSIQ